jgi:non-homologous end joining protein Ku
MTTRGTRTRLAFGRVTADVALYKSTGEPTELAFERAAPSGAPIRSELREAPAEPVLDALTGEVPSHDAVAEVQGKADFLRREADRMQHEADRKRALVERPMQQVHVDTATGEVLAPEEFRRGIRHGDRFIDLTEQLEEIDEAIKLDEMRIVAFIDVRQVRRERIQGSYYVGSAGAGAPKVLRLLYEAMRATKRVGVVKWSKTKNQALGVIVPHDGTLMVLEVCWSDCWRPAPSAALTLMEAEVSEAELEAASKLIRALSDTNVVFDELKDDRRRMREDLVEAALMGREWHVPREDDAIAAALAETLEAARG